MPDSSTRIEDQIASVADRLESEYADRVPAGVVRGFVSEAFIPLRDARVTQFVPVLVDRSVRQRLRSSQPHG
jgi:F420-0:gamma-glutamyl ligase